MGICKTLFGDNLQREVFFMTWFYSLSCFAELCLASNRSWSKLHNDHVFARVIVFQYFIGLIVRKQGLCYSVLTKVMYLRIHWRLSTTLRRSKKVYEVKIFKIKSMYMIWKWISLRENTNYRKIFFRHFLFNKMHGLSNFKTS